MTSAGFSPIRFLVASGLLALLITASVRSLRPPKPLPADAPADEFSAARADAALASVLANEGPHPAGTAANAAFRDRILNHLNRLGYRTQVQQQWSCAGAGSCAETENIIAWRGNIDGRDDLVLLACHYDSVPAGQGATDDGFGIATALESARALNVKPAGRPVVLLFTDAEESGLLGASAFVRHHPMWRQVKAVVNVETRGTSGQSLMFETSRQNTPIVALAARNARRPATGSFFYSVYEKLPNDTDFTVFARAGAAGANFASIGDALYYHTRFDDLAHLDRGTLQHHGDNALAMIRGLADPSTDLSARGRSIWFDVFTRFVVRFPESAAVPLAVLCFLLAVSAVYRNRQETPVGRTIAAAFIVLGTIVLATLAAFGVALILRRAGAFQEQWSAEPAMAIISFWLIPLVVVTAMALRKSDAITGGAALLFGLLAIVVSAILPGASYLFLVPAIGWTIAAWLKTPWRFAAPLLLTTPLLAPPAVLFYAAMGLTLLPATSALVTMIMLVLIEPLSELRRSLRISLVAVTAFLALSAALVAMRGEPYSPAYPQTSNVVVRTDADTKTTIWSLSGRDRLPAAVAKRWAWKTTTGVLPWSPSSFHVRAVDTAALPAPTLEILSNAQSEGGRAVRLRIRSHRKAERIALSIEQGSRIEKAMIEGVEPVQTSKSPSQILQNGWRRFYIRTVPEEGVVIELTMRGTESLNGVLEDTRLGAADIAPDLVRARDESAIPIQEGDLNIVTTKVRI